MHNMWMNKGTFQWNSWYAWILHFYVILYNMKFLLHFFPTLTLKKNPILACQLCKYWQEKFGLQTLTLNQQKVAVYGSMGDEIFGDADSRDDHQRAPACCQKKHREASTVSVPCCDGRIQSQGQLLWACWRRETSERDALSWQRTGLVGDQYCVGRDIVPNKGKQFGFGIRSCKEANLNKRRWPDRDAILLSVAQFECQGMKEVWVMLRAQALQLDCLGLNHWYCLDQRRWARGW